MLFARVALCGALCSGFVDILMTECAWIGMHYADGIYIWVHTMVGTLDNEGVDTSVSEWDDETFWQLIQDSNLYLVHSG